MNESFSTFDIKAILEIKIDRLKDWMNRGYISPSIQQASGIGTKNIFSREDLYLIRLFQHLLERGFSRKEAHFRLFPFWNESKEKLSDSKNFVAFFNIDKKTEYKLYKSIVFLNSTEFRELEKMDIDEYCDIIIVNIKKIRDYVDQHISRQ